MFVFLWQGIGNGANAIVPSRDVESEAVEKRQEEEKGVPSAEIAAALTDMAKSVAHLTMVVASLDSKITTLKKEKVAAAFSNNNMVNDDVTKPAENGGLYKNGNGAQLKWEVAVIKGQTVNEAKPQLLEVVRRSFVCITMMLMMVSFLNVTLTYVLAILGYKPSKAS